LNGNTATVKLVYANGWANDTLKFTSANAGTYRSETGLSSGTNGWHEGTFVITDYDPPVSGNNNGNNSSGTGSGTATTGQVVIWTDRAETGPISVVVDNGNVGTLTQYFTSGKPSCGDAGGITLRLPVGNHTVRATAEKRTWSLGSFEITAGGCLTYQLQ